MTRGRQPLMALREAVLIAKKRGETRQFMHEPGTICNFVIYCPGFVAHVRIKRVTRVHCPLHGSSVRQPMHSQHSGPSRPGPGSPASSGSSCPEGRSGSSGLRIPG
jgi:hypothetical protein